MEQTVNATQSTQMEQLIVIVALIAVFGFVVPILFGFKKGIQRNREEYTKYLDTVNKEPMPFVNDWAWILIGFPVLLIGVGMLVIGFIDKIEKSGVDVSGILLPK